MKKNIKNLKIISYKNKLMKAKQRMIFKKKNLNSKPI